jgi:hypothetical protein
VTITASLGVAVPASAPMLPAEAAPSHGSGARWDPPVSAAPRSAPPQPAARERATDSTPPASSPTVERRDSRSRRGRAAAADRDDLAAELAVLERARTALASHDLVSARDAIDEHRRRFPRGRLQLERQASAVMLACAERTDGATEAARDFLAREEAAPYRRRIEASCEL